MAAGRLNGTNLNEVSWADTLQYYSQFSSNARPTPKSCDKPQASLIFLNIVFLNSCKLHACHVCIVYCVSCVVYRVLCIVYRVSCIVYCACIVYRVL